MSEEEYQKRIDQDPTIRRLSPKTVREHEKAGMPPEERNPRGAGRRRCPASAPAPSVTMRVPGEMAEDVRRLTEQYRKNPDTVRDQLHELVTELNYYLENNA